VRQSERSGTVSFAKWASATWWPYSQSSTLLISAPSLGVYYCQQLTKMVCPSVCLSVTNFKSLLLFFVSRWNRAIFGLSVFHDLLYKTLFFEFWSRPPNAQNVLPKICTKSPIHRVPQKTVQTYFLSELCQLSTDCKNLWHKDSRENRLFWGVLIFHLI